MKGEHHIANTQTTRVMKRHAALNQLLVQERAVAAFEIFDEKRRTFLGYLAVISADRTNIDHDITFGVSSKDRFGAVEFILPTGLRAIICGEEGHPRMILGEK